MLELREVDGPIPVNVRLFQDLGKGRNEAAAPNLPPVSWAPLSQSRPGLTLSMSCFISESLSRMSSPSPVRQFTSRLRSSLSRVPSSSKSGGQTQEAQKDVVRRSSTSGAHFPSSIITRPVGKPLLVLTENAESIVGLDVWGCCVTEHTKEVQEVLEAQAVSGGRRGEDPADSLLEGVGLVEKDFCECPRTQSGQDLTRNFREQVLVPATWSPGSLGGSFRARMESHGDTGGPTEPAVMASWESK